MEFKFLLDPNTNEVSESVVLMIKDGVTSCVSNDPENKDWAAYQKWLADGNQTEEADSE